MKARATCVEVICNKYSRQNTIKLGGKASSCLLFKKQRTLKVIIATYFRGLQRFDDSNK